MEQEDLKETLNSVLEHANGQMSELEAQIAKASKTTKKQIKLATNQIEIEKQKVIDKVEDWEG